MRQARARRLDYAATQSLFARLCWFVVGGLLSVALNALIYLTVSQQLQQPRWLALAVSLTTITALFSSWNYFLNFRTTRRFRECTGRYLAVVLLCYVANYLVALSGLKHFGHTRMLELIVLASVQILVSGAKFVLYHRWVYPREQDDATAINARPARDRAPRVASE